MPTATPNDQPPTDRTRHGGRAGVAYDAIRRQIVAGMLAPGARVLEEGVAGQLGISRTPVREAIARLMAEGLIRKIDAGPPVVHRISTDEILEILHVRRLLEADAARQAAGAAGRDELLALREVFARYLDGETPNPAAHRDTDDALHAALARMARSPILAEMIANLRLRTRVFDKGEIPDRFEPGCREHIAIIDAVLIGDAEGAQSAMRTHLGNVGQSILAHLTRGTRSS